MAPLDIPLFRLKDKQAFNSSMLLLGKPIDLCKKLQKEGAKLVHIVDLDALKGLETNMDVYDHLTQFINIEVEIAPKETLLVKLLNMKARVVLELPCPVDLKKFRERRLLVGKVDGGFTGDSSMVHDLVIKDAKGADVERFAESNRIIVYEKDAEGLDRKMLWGVIRTF